MKFVRLTSPEGEPVWVGVAWITKVQKPTIGHYHKDTRALISMGANVQAVKEAPEAVVRLLEMGGDVSG